MEHWRDGKSPRHVDYVQRRIEADTLPCLRYRDKLVDDRVHEATIPNLEFLDRLIEHIRDPYMHEVRYFGLLSPRARFSRYAAFLRLLGLPEPSPVHPFHWADGLYLSSGVNPRVDSQGNRMSWSHNLPAQLPSKAF